MKINLSTLDICMSNEEEANQRKNREKLLQKARKDIPAWDMLDEIKEVFMAALELGGPVHKELITWDSDLKGDSDFRNEFYTNLKDHLEDSIKDYLDTVLTFVFDRSVYFGPISED